MIETIQQIKYYLIEPNVLEFAQQFLRNTLRQFKYKTPNELPMQLAKKINTTKLKKKTAKKQGGGGIYLIQITSKGAPWSFFSNIYPDWSPIQILQNQKLMYIMEQKLEGHL